jgi:preprotein translocase subunit YajC
MNPFDTAAHAADGAAPAAPGAGYLDMVLLVGFVAIFYFLLWRPQSKRRKEHQTLMSGLAKGDEIVTAGGLVGRITKVEDDFVKLEVAKDVEFRVQKSSVGATLPKGTLKSLDEK